jgi:hypothetical protein
VTSNQKLLFGIIFSTSISFFIGIHPVKYIFIG